MAARPRSRAAARRRECGDAGRSRLARGAGGRGVGGGVGQGGFCTNRWKRERRRCLPFGQIPQRRWPSVCGILRHSSNRRWAGSNTSRGCGISDTKAKRAKVGWRWHSLLPRKTSCCMPHGRRPEQVGSAPDTPCEGRDGIYYAPQPLASTGEVALVFPGSGNHFVGMGRPTRPRISRSPPRTRRRDGHPGRARSCPSGSCRIV